MTRALSVWDGNGAVSSFASQDRSCVGRDVRGYRAAWASAAEKSRHFRHTTGVGTVGALEAYKRGFVAWILERSGRDARGTGGGTPLELGSLTAPLVLPKDLLIAAKPDCLSLPSVSLEGGGGGSLRTGSGGFFFSSSLIVSDLSLVVLDGSGGGSRKACESLLSTE